MDQQIFANTICGWKSLKSLVYLLRSVEHLQGNIAEVGVYKGGSGKVLCDNTKDRVYLIDTFSGLPNTTENDLTTDNNYAHYEGDFNDTSVEHVRQVLKNNQNYEIIKSKWPNSEIKTLDDLLFKFVHIDVDLYQGYVDNIEYFWPKLVTNGIMVFDDYQAWTCPGSKKAVDEFLTKNSNVLFYTGPFPQAFVIKL